MAACARTAPLTAKPACARVAPVVWGCVCEGSEGPTTFEATIPAHLTRLSVQPGLS